MSLENVQLTLTIDLVKELKNEVYKIDGEIKEVKTKFGNTRYVVPVKDTKGEKWVVFLPEKEIRKIIMRFGRTNYVNSVVKFGVEKFTLMGVEKERIIIV